MTTLSQVIEAAEALKIELEHFLENHHVDEDPKEKVVETMNTLIEELESLEG